MFTGSPIATTRSPGVIVRSTAGTFPTFMPGAITRNGAHGSMLRPDREKQTEDSGQGHRGEEKRLERPRS